MVVHSDKVRITQPRSHTETRPVRYDRHSFIVHDGKLECFRVFPQTSGRRLFATVSFLGRLNSLALDIIIVMLRQSALWLYFFVWLRHPQKSRVLH